MGNVVCNQYTGECDGQMSEGAWHDRDYIKLGQHTVLYHKWVTLYLNVSFLQCDYTFN